METHPLLVGTYRLLLAAIVLSPLFIRDWRKHRDLMNFRDVVRLFWPGLFLGLHFASWAWGARLTAVANASLIINLAPIAMPVFAFLLVKERITVKEVSGTLIAVCGVFFLSWMDLSAGGENMKGNIVCFLSMLSFTMYLAFGRKYASYPSVWLYVVPLYAIAGVMSFLVSWVVLGDVVIRGQGDWGRMIVLTLVPTIVGHTILNYSLKTLSGQVVSVFNLHQFVFAATIAFFVYGEFPSWGFFVSAGICVYGASVVVREAARIARKKMQIPDSVDQ
tara:strand:- start:750 stop:1580 length:831 start_codon:yes stop_codon:yes gene_type:complete